MSKCTADRIQLMRSLKEIQNVLIGGLTMLFFKRDVGDPKFANLNTYLPRDLYGAWF